MEYIGYLPPDQLRQTLYDADIGIVSLSSIKHNNIAVARRMFDYAAAGLAIVYSGQDEGSQIIHDLDAGDVVPPGDPSALFKAIHRLVTDPPCLEQRKQASGRLLEGDFSDDVIAKKIIRLVQLIVDNSTFDMEFCGQ